MEQPWHQYAYPPLPQSMAGEDISKVPFTRLLLLAPGEWDEPFQGSLQIVNAAAAPTYEALSYTWGKEDPNSAIYLEGQRLSIRPSLDHALRHLRSPMEARHLWVDAICIDQSSLSERSRQVQYMRLVYKHATRVIAWLGLETPGVEHAVELSKRIAEIRRGMERSELSTNETVDKQTVYEVMIEAWGDVAEDALPCLIDLLHRPYFQRCWCIQETVASSCAIAKIGKLEVSFPDLLACTSWVTALRAFVEGFSEAAGRPFKVEKIANYAHTKGFWNLMYHMKWSTGPKPPEEYAMQRRSNGDDTSMGPLIQLLATTREFQATDPRDKVFSLIGISNEGVNPYYIQGKMISGLRGMAAQVVVSIYNNIPKGDAPLPQDLRPDYTKDCVLVYRDVARYLLRQAPRILQVLSYVQHTSDPTSGGFPSWVPRWDEPRSCSPLDYGLFGAGRALNGVLAAQIHDNSYARSIQRPDVLALDGYGVGRVQRMSETLSEVGARDILVLEQLWNQLFAFPMVPRNNHPPYVSGEALDIAFCMTASIGALGTLTTPGVEQLQGFALQNYENPRERFTRQAQGDVANFLIDLAKQRGADPATWASLTPTATAGGDFERFTGGVYFFAQGRRVFITETGQLGLGPQTMQVGDEVVVLLGARFPCILRPRPDHHLFVGDCYIHDDRIMWGEATAAIYKSQAQSKFRTFELR